MTGRYDVIVVGGGHAGIEASHAAARMGAKTLLITMNVERIGEMSCNPAIGGLGKSQLVKEIDALGGLQARLTDRCGIHFRRLNRSKGPAVQSTRIQCDKGLYREFARRVLEETENLYIWQDKVNSLYIEEEKVVGVEALIAGRVYARVVVLAPGTFLRGLMHIGDKNFDGGRLGDQTSISLPNSLRVLGFEMGRFKTGTPPRLDARSINYAKMQAQFGEEPPPGMSFFSRRKLVNQVQCHITRTNSQVHKVITSNLELSAMYSGNITGTGVRYCPSIEDKIVRFADKDSHRVFIEPEGANTHEVYPNGLSTSMPLEVQLRMVRLVPGLEKAQFIRPGYAIEHDYVQPTQLTSWLEAKNIGNLFLAGQINGTTGYEEAAAQGLIAGLNAALRIKEKEPFALGRDEAYIGVLIDDLITRGTAEPYRMFTSRVEYRLLLREDNAYARLSEKAYRLGLLREKDYKKVALAEKGIRKAIGQLEQLRPSLEETNAVLTSLDLSLATEKLSLADILRRPKVSISEISALEQSIQNLTPFQKERVEIEVKYQGYIKRSMEDVQRFQKIEKVKIPETLDYKAVPGVSNEIIEKLSAIRPATLGQASRISGVTPVALLALFRYLKSYKPSGKSKR